MIYIILKRKGDDLVSKKYEYLAKVEVEDKNYRKIIPLRNSDEDRAMWFSPDSMMQRTLQLKEGDRVKVIIRKLKK